MKRSCFTLVELLVVVAIITLLVALSIGALRSSKQRAKSLLCMSRIRQLAVGLTMYEEDNQTFPYGFREEFTPPPGGYPGSPVYDRLGLWWFHSMQGYGDVNEVIFCCPSKSLSLPKLKKCILYGNYGVNRSICKSPSDTQSRMEFAGDPLARSDIPQPSRTLLIVDSGYSIISWWYATDIPPAPIIGTGGRDAAYIPGLEINKNRKLLPGLEQDAVDGRHPSRTVNAGFADGHVDAVRADDLFVQKTTDGYANRSPLWLPK